MATTLFSLANEALLRADFELAIRIYSEILCGQPTLSEHSAFNLKIARQRYRKARAGAKLRVGIFGDTGNEGRCVVLKAIYKTFASAEHKRVAIGPAAEASAARDDCVAADSARAFLPAVIDFVLSNPFDIVHLGAPNLPNVVVGALYKLLWDASVFVDVSTEVPVDIEVLQAPPKDVTQPASDLDGDANRRRAYQHVGTFDGVTTSHAEFGRIYGAVPVSRSDAATLRNLVGRPASSGLDASAQLGLIESLGGWSAFRRVPKSGIPIEKLVADRRRMIVYSVLTGAYETMKEPEVIDPEARYLLFTDDPNLKSEKWEVVVFDARGLGARRASRLPKLLPHLYLPPHDVSVYVDASLAPVIPSVAAMAGASLQGHDFAAYAHCARDCTYDEIAECIRCGKSDKASAEKFLERLASERFPPRQGLLENAFLVRRNTSVSRRVNELWFQEYMEGAERDQFYLMYILWRARIPYAVISDAPDFRDSPHAHYTKHRGDGATPCGDTEIALAKTFGAPRKADLESRCEKTLAMDLRAMLSTNDGGRQASHLDKLYGAIVDLEFRDLPSARNYRDALSARLFPVSGASRHSRLRRPRIAYLTDPSLPASATENERLRRTCLGLARAGADVVVYAEAGFDSACGAAGIFRRAPMRSSEERGGVGRLHQLVRQAIAGGCTHVYTRCIDVAVLSVIAGLPTALELHAAVPARQSRKFEFLARSPALDSLIVAGEALAEKCKGVFKGLESRILVLRDGVDGVCAPPLFASAHDVDGLFASRTKPIINWVIGGASSVGWAYENNAKRLISGLPQYEHRINSEEYSDCAIYFDAIIHKKFPKPSRKSVLRLGGPNPLKIVYGADPERVTRGLSQFDGIVALSGELQAAAAGSGARIVFTPNGVDLTTYHPLHTPRTSGEFVAGFAGNCKSEMERNFKGFEFAEQGAKLAGVGFIALKKQESQIPHDRMVPDFYHKIDCLVHPVAKGKEGSSNVIMEALACGIPVITTRHAGYHGEALTEFENVLFCEREAADICAKINLLKNDEDLRTRLSVNARMFAERSHSMEHVAGIYQDLFDSILESRRPRQANLNIALVTKSFWPKFAGMELMVHNLATALKRMGNSVVLFAAEYRGAYREIEHEYSLSRYHRSAEGLQEQFGRRHKERPFDVIYVQGAHVTAGWALQLRKEYGVPVVLRTHGDDIQIDRDINYGLRLDPEIDAEVRGNLAATDANVAIGVHILDETRALAPHVDAELIHNGVDMQRFAGKKTAWLHEKLCLPRDTRILLTVGRNVRKKSFHLAIAALAKVKSSLENVALVHVGKEGDGEDLRAAAAALGVDKSFFAIGEIDYFSMPQVYAAADLFVFSAKAETFGNVTIEAMASGLPCVEFDYVVNRDKILHGETGYVVEYGDVDAMAARILELLRDDQKRAAFSASGRRHIERTFAWPVIAAKYHAVFRRVISKTRRPTLPSPAQRKLRVAIAADKFVNIKGGGGEKSLADLANALADRGHEVFLVIKEANVCQFHKPFYPINPGVNLRNIYGWSGEGAGAATSRRELRLGSAIREIGPDVVVGFFLPEFGYVAEALRDIDVPLVLSHRNDPQQKMADLKRRHPGRLQSTAFAYQRCQLMTVQMAPYALMLPPDVQGKVAVIPNAVPPAREEMLASPEAAGGRNVILNVGRLAPAKNQRLLIYAFARIAHLHPTWDIKIYGDGPLEAEVRALIASVGMQDRIHLMGTVADIEPVYRDAKIFAFPSLYEGFSRALSEAMAHRLPSVCVETCICSRDFISASGGGLLSTDHVGAFAEALATLITNAGLRKEMGIKAAGFVAQFTSKGVFDLWERHLRDVVAAAEQGAAVKVDGPPRGMILQTAERGSSRTAR